MSFWTAITRVFRHIISARASGVLVDPAKITSMVNCPSPKDVKGLGFLLGLASYYRKFVRNYEKGAHPFTQSLEKEAFVGIKKLY